MNKEQYRDAKTVFSGNLNVLLSEKGLDDTPHETLANMINTTWQKKVVSERTIRRWRNGQALPSYSQFGLLADWLDCEESDLLPVKEQECLRGFWCE